MFPVFSLVLDKDVTSDIALMYPELYKELTKVCTVARSFVSAGSLQCNVCLSFRVVQLHSRHSSYGSLYQYIKVCLFIYQISQLNCKSCPDWPSHFRCHNHVWSIATVWSGFPSHYVYYVHLSNIDWTAHGCSHHPKMALADDSCWIHLTYCLHPISGLSQTVFWYVSA